MKINNNIKYLLIGIIVFTITFGIGSFALSFIEDNVELKELSECEIVVKDKYIKNNPSTGLDQYLIVDIENNTYKIVDTEERKNSTDLYNIMDKGKKYNCVIEGERIPEISEYPNIIKIQNT